jgi:hypothetical protein
METRSADRGRLGNQSADRGRFLSLGSSMEEVQGVHWFPACGDKRWGTDDVLRYGSVDDVLRYGRRTEVRTSYTPLGTDDVLRYGQVIHPWVRTTYWGTDPSTTYCGTDDVYEIMLNHKDFGILSSQESHWGLYFYQVSHMYSEYCTQWVCQVQIFCHLNMQSKWHYSLSLGVSTSLNALSSCISTRHRSLNY